MLYDVWIDSWSTARWYFLGGGRLSLFSDYRTELRWHLPLRRQLCLLIRDPYGVIDDWASVELRQRLVSTCLILSAELKTYCCCKHHICSLNHPKKSQQLKKDHGISQTTDCGYLFCLVISEVLGTQVMFSPVFSNYKNWNILKAHTCNSLKTKTNQQKTNHILDASKAQALRKNFKYHRSWQQYRPYYPFFRSTGTWNNHDPAETPRYDLQGCSGSDLFILNSVRLLWLWGDLGHAFRDHSCTLLPPWKKTTLHIPPAVICI